MERRHQCELRRGILLQRYCDGRGCPDGDGDRVHKLLPDSETFHCHRQTYNKWRQYGLVVQRIKPKPVVDSNFGHAHVLGRSVNHLVRDAGGRESAPFRDDRLPDYGDEYQGLTSAPPLGMFRSRLTSFQGVRAVIVNAFELTPLTGFVWKAARECGFASLRQGV